MRNLKDEKRGRNGRRSSGMKEKWHDVFVYKLTPEEEKKSEDIHSL